jgi:predicted dehydrogenase
MVKVLLIGCGQWGKNYIRTVNESRLGIIDQVLTSKSHGVRGESLARAAVKNESDENEKTDLLGSVDLRGIDAAIVSTHPPATAAYTIALLKRGIHVMAEKPFTFSEHTLHLVEDILTRDPSLVFLVNHQHLFSHAVSKIRDLFGTIPITHFDVSAGGLGPFRTYRPSLDYGPHDYSLLQYLTDGSIELDSYKCTEGIGGTREELTIRVPSNLTGIMTFWNNAPPKTHKVLLSYGATLVTYDDYDAAGRLKVDGESVSCPYSPPLTLAVSAFLSNINKGRHNNDKRFGTSQTRRYNSLMSKLVCISKGEAQENLCARTSIS